MRTCLNCTPSWDSVERNAHLLLASDRVGVHFNAFGYGINLCGVGVFAMGISTPREHGEEHVDGNAIKTSTTHCRRCIHKERHGMFR